MNVEQHFSQALGGAILASRVTLHGESWAAPLGLVNAPAGFGEEVWDLEYPNILSWNMEGAVVSETPGFAGRTTRAGDGKIGLQLRSAPGRYRADGSVRFGHFHVSDGLLARTAEGLDLPDFKEASLRPDIVLIEDRSLVAMLELYGRRTLDELNPPSRIEMEARALLIVEHLVRTYHTARPAPLRRGGLAPWQLKRACEAMMAEIDRNPGLDDLAEVVGCSPTHFSRAFKQSTGLAPFHWLAERRIEKAKALLEEGGLSLAEIALAVGFSAQPQFTTAFGRATGVTPGQWRRKRLS